MFKFFCLVSKFSIFFSTPFRGHFWNYRWPTRLSSGIYANNYSPIISFQINCENIADKETSFRIHPTDHPLPIQIGNYHIVHKLFIQYKSYKRELPHIKLITKEISIQPTELKKSYLISGSSNLQRMAGKGCNLKTDSAKLRWKNPVGWKWIQKHQTQPSMLYSLCATIQRWYLEEDHLILRTLVQRTQLKLLSIRILIDILEVGVRGIKKLWLWWNLYL